MSCPTCSGPMQRFGETEVRFWCPRCGTLESCVYDEAGKLNVKHEAPKLVSRVRELLRRVPMTEALKIDVLECVFFRGIDE